MTKNSVAQTIHERLESFRQQSRIKAGSLIVSVFGDAVLPRGSSQSVQQPLKYLNDDGQRQNNPE